MTTRTFRVCDLFCGAGGSSSGALRAIRALGAEMDLVAVNHWPTAIETHSRNHPTARHYVADVNAARPEELVPEGELDLLMASPECTHFSRARGGKPVHDQRRSGAWAVHHWATTLNVRCILVENVAEFLEWGDMRPDGKPDPTKKGMYFQAWYTALAALGYAIDWRLLNAADFGDATTRTRLFVQARKDGQPIRWPEPTHSRTGAADMFGRLSKWRAAREVIDWTNPGRSLLTRTRPLSLKTRLRIARGLARFGGQLAPLYISLLDLPAEDAARFTAPAAGAAAPFVLANRNNNAPKSDGEPVPAITTAGGGGIFVTSPTAEPFVSAFRNHTAARGMDEPVPTMTAGNGSGGLALVSPDLEPFTLGKTENTIPHSVEDPLDTLTTDSGPALVEPAIIPYYSTGVADSVNDPLATVTTKARFGLCCPLVVPYGPKAEARDVEQPMPTVLTKDRLGVATPTVEPFVLSRNNGLDGSEHARAHPVDDPLPTATARGAGYLVEPFIVPNFGEAPGQAPRTHAIDAPMPAVTSHGAGALVHPSIVQVNHGGERDGRVQSVETPLPTITSKRGSALIEPVLVQTDQTGSAGVIRSLDEPIPTVVSKQNVALAEPVATPADGDVDSRRLVLIDGVLHVLDIRFRMLTNDELARAMGFSDDEVRYEFSGNIGEVTKQIGNAVAVGTAAALVGAILGHEAAREAAAS